MPVLLIASHELAGPLPEHDVELLVATRVNAIQPLLASYAAAIIVSDGFSEAQLAELAAAVRTSGIVAVEVRTARWDGQTPSPLSAACRGVISGFGEAGIAAALGFLNAPAA